MALSGIDIAGKGIGGIGAIIYREMRLFFGDMGTVILSLISPLIYMFFFSASLGQMMPLLSYNGVQATYIEFVLPGILVMTSLNSALMTSQSVFNEKLSNMLLEILSTPVQHKAYMIGKITASTVLGVFQSILMFACGILVFGVPISLYTFLGILLIDIVVCLTMSGFYMTVMGLVNDFRTFILTCNILSSVIMFGSPIFYPVEQIPAGLQVIAKANPVTYCCDAVRSFFLLGKVPSEIMLLTCCLAVVFTGTAVMVFAKRFREV